MAFQAADLLAYEGRKQTALQVGQNERPARKMLRLLEHKMNMKPHSWFFFNDAATLQHLAESLYRAMGGDIGDLYDAASEA